MLRQLRDTILARESLVLIFATALLCVLGYHNCFGLLSARYRLLEEWITEGLAFLAVPSLFSWLVLRKNPLRLGLGLGDYRTWASYCALFAMAMAGIVLVIARADPSFSSYYPVYGPARDSFLAFLVYALSYATYLLGWEYLFRGFLLFSLAPRFGHLAVVVQMVPFALLHIGKPELEAYSSILGGLILGVLALRTRSMWPCFLLHAFTALWMTACVVYIWR